METKYIFYELRTKKGLTQDALAAQVFVTRQAVSRWETGETVPNTDTLKLLSELFGVSINTLLGVPQNRICQCCGMPLEDDLISLEKDGTPNADYCKWCYADGTYMYHDMDELIEVYVRNIADEVHPADAMRAYFRDMLPQLDYWKRHTELGDGGAFEAFKKQLVDEINALHIAGMPKLEGLNALVGSFVNLTYPLPNGDTVRFLDDNATYLGNQLESLNDEKRCFGVLANMDFILISTYGENGTDPELILYQKRLPSADEA